MEWLNGFMVGFVTGFLTGPLALVWMIYRGRKKEKKPSKVLAIFKRTKPDPHFEVHFDDRVEFWDLANRKTGESKVQPYP